MGDWLDASIIISGIAWTITYIALVYRGFKDKTYGMPLFPLALNFTWEITFSVIYPNESNVAGTVINIVWMICDVGIVATYFLYGYSEHQRYMISKRAWIFFSIFTFGISMGIMLTVGQFFEQFSVFFHSESFEGAKFIAFWQNLVMSIAMILMFWERQSIRGQSFTIAWTKWIGTSISVGTSYLFITHEGEKTDMMIIVIATTFVLDLYYMALIFEQIRKEGMNPFLRL